MIYTVTFNPALDYVMNVTSLNSKDINRTENEQLYYGGKGINVSVILSNLGIDNEALGFLAGFSGKEIERMLNKDNIKNDFIFLKSGHSRINVKIRAQKEIDINAQGPEITENDINLMISKLKKIQSGDTLVLAGSIPKTMPCDIYEKILEQLEGKEIDFVVDATGNLLLNVLKFRPFLIKPNHHELGEIFNTEITASDDIVEHAKKLQKMGARNVLVSRGKDGAILVDEFSNTHTIGNIPGKIKNSVGCGDSMVAGFLAGWSVKKDYSYALKLGTICGNATAFSDTLATKEEISNIFNSKYFD